MKLNIGAKPATWDAWMARWNSPGLSLYEQLGLLHHGYDIEIAESDGNAIAGRFALYLELANRTGLSREELQSGGEALSLKARSMLVNRVFGKSGDVRIALTGPFQSRTVDLLKAFFCDIDTRHRYNWFFYRLGTDHENIELSDWFMTFLRYCVSKDGQALGLKDDLIFTAFIKAPFELQDKARRFTVDEFNLTDFRRLLDRLRGEGLSIEDPGQLDARGLLDMVVSRKPVRSGSSIDSMGSRHHDALIVMVSRLSLSEV